MKRTVRTTVVVDVEVDESKFTPAFMESFRSTMYDFRTIDDHVAHLGQMHARGLCDDFSFIEGYGPAKDMGIRFTDRPRDGDQEIVS